jgi:hypothetical protein
MIGLTQRANVENETAVLFLLLYFVFALAERKNEIQISQKYHAAAGKTAFESATA